MLVKLTIHPFASEGELTTKHKLKRQSGKLKIPFAGNGGGGLTNYPSLTG
jgi:hypothetical protein